MPRFAGFVMTDAVVLQARNLARVGIVHGFTTRQGGCSSGAFASFNLSLAVGDDAALVGRNQEQFQAKTGIDWNSLICLNQLHGSEVLVVEHPVARLPPESERRFDASVTSRADVVLAIRTADCFPILMAAPQGKAVAVAHAGWRGTLAGIASKTVSVLCSIASCRPQELLVAIGPGIHACCYQAGPEVGTPFLDRFGQEVAQKESDDRFRVDLMAANQQLLIGAGVPAESIEVLDFCTSCHSDLFFSHRRDRGRTGRHLAFVRLPREGRG